MTTLPEVEAEIAGLERNRQQMRLVNRLLRHSNEGQLRALGYTEEQIAALKQPDAAGHVGFQPAVLDHTENRLALLRAKAKDMRRAG